MSDLEFVDGELYNNLRALPSMDEDDIEDLCVVGYCAVVVVVVVVVVC